MAQGDRFDPGYFENRATTAANQYANNNGNNRNKIGLYRKPGFDLGTILWPFLGVLIHLLTSSIVMFVWSFGEIFFNPSLREVFLNGANTEEATIVLNDILMDNFIPKAIVYSIIQIILYGLIIARRQKVEKDYVLLRKGRAFDWFASLSMIITSLGIALLWMTLLTVLAESLPYFSDMMQSYEELAEGAFTMGDNSVLVMTLGIAILVPIAEELLFRGIFMAEMRRIMPAWLVIVLNGLLFAIFHWQLVQSVYVFIAGLALAAAYLWTESLWIPIAMHMLYNFFGSVFGQILGTNELAAVIYSIAIILFSIIGLVCAFLLYKKRQTPYKRPRPWSDEQAHVQEIQFYN